MLRSGAAENIEITKHVGDKGMIVCSDFQLEIKQRTCIFTATILDFKVKVGEKHISKVVILNSGGHRLIVYELALVINLPQFHCFEIRISM